MKKYSLLVILVLFAVSSYAANTFSIYGNSGWIRLNTTNSNGTFVCLADGTNCPSNVSGSNNYPTNLTVTNGSTHTITIGRNGLSALVASFDDTTGAGGGSIEGVISLDSYLRIINSTVVNASLNTTALAENCTSGEYSRWNGTRFTCFTDSSGGSGTVTNVTQGFFMSFSVDPIVTTGIVSLDSAALVANIMNWSSDRSNYVNYTSLYSILNGQNNLSLAQIVANTMNWSQDRSSYVNFTVLNSMNNLSLAQIVANIGNLSSVANSICYGNGTNCPSVTNGSAGSGNVTGGGSAGVISKWSNATQVVNSIAQDNGATVSIQGNLTLNGSSNTYAGSIFTTNENRLYLNSSAVVAGNETHGVFIIRSCSATAPNYYLASGEIGVSCYDNGITPVMRYRYNDSGTMKSFDAGPFT